MDSPRLPAVGERSAAPTAPELAREQERSASVPPGARTPDFFIAGHQKCGTTALWQMLDGHPEIFMSQVKEPRFFAPDLWSRFPPKQPGLRRLHTLEGYLELFAEARPEQRAGEASPEYLRSVEAAGRIADCRPDARVIAILREPADFLRSFHLQMVMSGVESEKDFRKAIGLEDTRRQGRRVPPRSPHPKSLLYSDHIRYTEQLQRFHAAFPPEQVLVLIYDDFRKDNIATVRRVLSFLGVDEQAPIEQVETLRLKAIRAGPLHRLAGAMRKARVSPQAANPVARALNAAMPSAVFSESFGARWRSVVYSTPKPPAESFMRELRGRFKPEVERISEYLGRDLVELWGYEDLD